jgi:leucyl aminopeptidase (aminopeptidase T)
MHSLELIQSVRLITDVCLEVAPGEDVLCITDKEENMDVITLIAAECKAKGADAAVVLIEPRKQHFHEPPPSVARAMKEADVIIAMASLMHTKARKESCAAGVKYASMGSITKEYLCSLNITPDDLFEVRALTEKIAQLLTAASSAHLTTRAGTDLRMSVEGRNGIALVPFGKKGSFCILPDYAEAPCAPIEESVEGVAVVDGSMTGEPKLQGLVEEPFEIYFEKGRIVKISGGKDGRRLQSLLDSVEEEARTFAELGVNSNHKVSKKLIGTKFDDTIAGHIHFGLGRNDHIGGNSRGNTHLDLLVTWATLLLDGKPILEDGNLKIQTEREFLTKRKERKS